MTPEGVIAGQKTRPTEPPLVNRKHIAHMNTLAMIRAQEQLYSPVADFGWLDEMGKYSIRLEAVLEREDFGLGPGLKWLTLRFRSDCEARPQFEWRKHP